MRKICTKNRNRSFLSGNNSRTLSKDDWNECTVPAWSNLRELLIIKNNRTNSKQIRFIN